MCGNICIVFEYVLFVCLIWWCYLYAKREFWAWITIRFITIIINKIINIIVLSYTCVCVCVCASWLGGCVAAHGHESNAVKAIRTNTVTRTHTHTHNTLHGEYSPFLTTIYKYKPVSHYCHKCTLANELHYNIYIRICLLLMHVDCVSLSNITLI